MTTVRELDDLANMCLECAEGDPSSLDDHLNSCPVCVEYGEKVESHTMTVEVLGIMAAKPETERRTMLETRIQRFFAEADQTKRMRELRELMDPLNELPEAERDSIVRTRTRILLSLPTEKRNLLLSSLQEIYRGWSPEFRGAEQKAIRTVSGEYPILKRIILRRMHGKILGSPTKK